MYRKKKIVAIIPARKGSKSIKNKNLSLLGRKSLLEISAKFIKNIKFIDYSIITSDSSSYIDIARKNGIKDSLKRKTILSSDNAFIGNVIDNVLKFLDNKKLKFDYILLIEPTSPFRKISDIKKVLNKIIIENAYSVFTISKIDKKFHPMKILKLINNKIQYYSRKGKNIKNKQEIKNDFYFKNGLVYAINAKKFRKKKLIISSNSYPIVTKRDIVNIDSLIDLKWANFLYRNEKKN